MSLFRYLWILVTGRASTAGDVSATFADRQPSLILDNLSLILPQGVDLRVDVQYLTEDPPAPYYYGRPPAAELGKGEDLIRLCKEKGCDCSGLVLSLAVEEGLCTPEWAEAHRTTSAIMTGCTALGKDWAGVNPGDVAGYSGHVAMVFALADDGCPLCISASGGGESTHGDDPDAHAKIVRADYRSDFLGFYRFPSE